MTDISIIIVNYNGTGFIEDCLESIKNDFASGKKGISYNTVIVDNASSDGSPGYLGDFCRKNKDFRLIKNSSNKGFGAASNTGAYQSDGEFLLFLNPDCRILGGDIMDVLDFYRKSCDSGVLGVRVLDKNGRLQFSCRAFPTLARQFYESYFLHRILRSSRIFGSYFMTWWNHSTSREVDWLSGSFMLIKEKIFREAGGFDQDYFMYSEDTDLCLKLFRRGYKNYYYPRYSIEHADAGIASRNMSQREAEVWSSRRKYFKKNYSVLHAAIFSLIYLAGVINRVIIFGLGSLFSAGAAKRAVVYLKALKRYYGKGSEKRSAKA